MARLSAELTDKVRSILFKAELIRWDNASRVKLEETVKVLQSMRDHGQLLFRKAPNGQHVLLHITQTKGPVRVNFGEFNETLLGVKGGSNPYFLEGDL